MMGTGGDGGAAGAFICLNLAGSIGSTGNSCMRMMRVSPSFAPVYLT